MNRKDLVRAVTDATGLSSVDAGKAVDGMLNAISSALERGETVKLGNLGNLSSFQRSARVGRNPRTGEALNLGPRVAVRYKASQAILKRLNPAAFDDPLPSEDAAEREEASLDGNTDDDGFGGPRLDE